MIFGWKKWFWTEKWFCTAKIFYVKIKNDHNFNMVLSIFNIKKAILCSFLWGYSRTCSKSNLIVFLSQKRDFHKKTFFNTKNILKKIMSFFRDIFIEKVSVFPSLNFFQRPRQRPLPLIMIIMIILIMMIIMIIMIMMIMMTMMSMMAMVMAMIKRCGRARQVSRKICPRKKGFKNIYVKGSRDL